MNQHLRFAATFVVALLFLETQSVYAETAPAKLDLTLRPQQEANESIPKVFKEMVVVQRKAKQKAGHYLFNAFGSLDFSDGPTTLYGLNLDVGYAISDYFEVYANYVPVFIANERKIVSQVSAASSGQIQISYAKPQMQYGVEILWAPAYGKDSWSPYKIVRSDTFFKLGVGQIKYDTDSGLRYNFTIGKTFFLSNLFNLRLGAGGSYIQIPVNGIKTYYTVAIIELGLIWYL